MFMVGVFCVVYIICQPVLGETNGTLTSQESNALESGNATFTCRITTEKTPMQRKRCKRLNGWMYSINNQVWIRDDDDVANVVVPDFCDRVRVNSTATQTEHIYNLTIKNAEQSDNGYQIRCEISDLGIQGVTPIADLQTQTELTSTITPNTNSQTLPKKSITTAPIPSNTPNATSHCFQITSVYIVIAMAVLGWLIAITMGAIFFCSGKSKSASSDDESSAVVMAPIDGRVSHDETDTMCIDIDECDTVNYTDNTYEVPMQSNVKTNPSNNGIQMSGDQANDTYEVPMQNTTHCSTSGIPCATPNQTLACDTYEVPIQINIQPNTTSLSNSGIPRQTSDDQAYDSYEVPMQSGVKANTTGDGLRCAEPNQISEDNTYEDHQNDDTDNDIDTVLEQKSEDIPDYSDTKPQFDVSSMKYSVCFGERCVSIYTE